MKLVAGLGNPGAKYEKTRHNAGFWWIDAVARRLGAHLSADKAYHGLVARVNRPAGPIWLIEPQTYMNLSGKSVAPLARFFRIAPEEILVVHDELDVLPGQMKLKQGGGSAGHNGMESIISSIGTKQFARLRVGVGQQHKGDPVTYLLKPASQARRKEMEQIAEQGAEAVERMIRDGVAQAMNQVNRRAEDTQARP